MKGELGFPRMADVVPQGSRGMFRVEHFTVTEEDAEWSRLRAMMSGEDPVDPGKYARLMYGSQVIMSDTWMERRTNAGARIDARGKVLIGGLGLGMVVQGIARKPEVDSVTVIEKSPDVIALVASSLPKRKVLVIEADVFEWKPPKGIRYDTIYFDIWPEISVDNLAEVTRLHRRFAPYLCRDPKGSMSSWQADQLRYLRRANRWR